MNHNKNIRFLFVALLLPHWFFLNAASIQSIKTGDWNEASTWKGGKIPTISDDITLDIGHTITVSYGETHCKSLIINGIIIIRNGNLTVGEWSVKTAPCLVNGTFQLEGDYSHQVKINGYLKFNAGSKFIMTSGALNVDGTTNSAASSVPANQALLDIGAAETFNAQAGAIIINNPHFHASGVCIKGVKKFDNTIVWGNNLAEPVTSPFDFVISETEKPILTSMRLSYVSYPNKTTRFAAKDLDLLGLLNVNAGYFYASGTVRIAKDLLIGDNIQIEANIEMNGLTQQNVTTYGTNNSGKIKGNFTINNPDKVNLNIDLNVENLYFKQGKLTLSSKNLTVNGAIIDANANRYIVSHNATQNLGKVLIKGLKKDTVYFPLGTERTYTPLSLRADSGDFQVSIHPLSISAPAGFASLKNAWQIERLVGKATADIEFQWTNTDENADFTSQRTNCNVYRYDKDKWTVLGTTVGFGALDATTFSKKLRFVDAFSTFTLFTASKSNVTPTHDFEDKQAMTVYPNPVNKNAVLNIDLSQPSLIYIYDLHGHLVYQSKRSENATIDTQNWAKGIYFIHTRFDKQKSIRKLIVD